MGDLPFRSALLSKDRSQCNKFIVDKFDLDILVQLINDLIYVSALTKEPLAKHYHPVCVINSIKNIIGNNRDKPSNLLLQFGIDFLFSFDYRDNDQILLNNAIKDGLGLTAFVGDLEDAYQNKLWKDAELLTTKLFLASDRTRGTLDSLVSLALQDTNRNAVFVYHLLRALQFQEIKKDIWAFTQCLSRWLVFRDLPIPNTGKNKSPIDIFDLIIRYGDMVLFSAVSRIWDGDYVHGRSYNRELSHWCDDVQIISKKKILPNHDHWLINMDKQNIIFEAESIIKGSDAILVKGDKLVLLESVIALSRKANEQQRAILGARLNQNIL